MLARYNGQLVTHLLHPNTSLLLLSGAPQTCAGEEWQGRQYLHFPWSMPCNTQVRSIHVCVCASKQANVSVTIIDLSGSGV